MRSEIDDLLGYALGKKSRINMIYIYINTQDTKATESGMNE